VTSLQMSWIRYPRALSLHVGPRRQGRSQLRFYHHTRSPSSIRMWLPANDHFRFGIMPWSDAGGRTVKMS
jgi:hypothetical protein